MAQFVDTEAAAEPFSADEDEDALDALNGVDPAELGMGSDDDEEEAGDEEAVHRVRAEQEVLEDALGLHQQLRTLSAGTLESIRQIAQSKAQQKKAKRRRPVLDEEEEEEEEAAGDAPAPPATQPPPLAGVTPRPGGVKSLAEQLKVPSLTTHEADDATITAMDQETLSLEELKVAPPGPAKRQPKSRPSGKDLDHQKLEAEVEAMVETLQSPKAAAPTPHRPLKLDSTSVNFSRPHRPEAKKSKAKSKSKPQQTESKEMLQVQFIQPKTPTEKNTDADLQGPVKAKAVCVRACTSDANRVVIKGTPNGYFYERANTPLPALTHPPDSDAFLGQAISTKHLAHYKLVKPAPAEAEAKFQWVSLLPCHNGSPGGPVKEYAIADSESARFIRRLMRTHARERAPKEGGKPPPPERSAKTRIPWDTFAKYEGMKKSKKGECPIIPWSMWLRYVAARNKREEAKRRKEEEAEEATETEASEEEEAQASSDEGEAAEAPPSRKRKPPVKPKPNAKPKVSPPPPRKRKPSAPPAKNAAAPVATPPSKNKRAKKAANGASTKDTTGVPGLQDTLFKILEKVEVAKMTEAKLEGFLAWVDRCDGLGKAFSQVASPKEFVGMLLHSATMPDLRHRLRAKVQAANARLAALRAPPPSPEPDEVEADEDEAAVELEF